jgi:hypothetical protein
MLKQRPTEAGCETDAAASIQDSPMQETARWVNEHWLKLRFGQAEVEAAHNEWGCNCGPAALAAVMGLTLDEVRLCLGDFEERGYMNVSMMRSAIAAAGGRINGEVDCGPGRDFYPLGRFGLVRIQRGGPWIIDGKPARWAATASHWIASIHGPGGLQFIYDINSGLVPWGEWDRGVAPAIMREIKRCDGSYYLGNDPFDAPK